MIYNNLLYRMAKTYCHINHCDTCVQYFAILHAVKKTYNTENTLTLTFIHKNECVIVGRKNHYVVRRKILAIR